MCKKSINNIIKKTKKRFDKKCFNVELERKIKENQVNYQVEYLMEKNEDPCKKNDHKYAMRVYWENNYGNSKYCIIIGQNPSLSRSIKKSEYHVDDTNWNIIKILRKKGYKGYIMLNTFSTINPSGSSINAPASQDNSTNVEISKYIIKKMRHLDIIIACTQNNYVAEDYIDMLNCKFKSRLKKMVYNNVVISHFSTIVLNRNKILKNIKNIQIIKATIEKTNNNCKIKF